MPLIIVVVFIIFIFVKLHEDKKEHDKLSAMRQKDRTKTNAVLERRLVDDYMKRGYSFDKAFRQSHEDILTAGYEPCIPRNAYSRNRNGVQSSYCDNPSQYDSFWVQQRRNVLVREWTSSHRGEPIPYELIDEQIYTNYPQTDR
jgi:hypothetical protein